MKVKLSVIPFIPAALAMIVLRVMSIFGADPNGKLLGMDKMAVAYTVIGISLALFIVCIVINIFDRKTAPVYPVKKNLAAGILSILSGAMVIANSVGTFMNTTTDSEYYVMTLVCAIFSLPAGIAFFLMSRVHFVGKSVVSGISMLFVFPALWGCSELVYEFLNATKVSISATDLSSLFCYIFITLYYFSHSMVVSRIKGRNPVKGCFIYGLPAVALMLSNSLYTFFTGIQEGTGYVSALAAAQFLVLALYAGSFIAEMVLNSVTKDEFEIIDGLPKPETMAEEEKKYIKTEGYDDLVFPESGGATHSEPAETTESVFPGYNDIEVISDIPVEEPTEPEPAMQVEEAPKQAEPVQEAPQAEQIAVPEPESPLDAPSEYYHSAKGMDDFIIGYKTPTDDEPIPYFTQAEKDSAADDTFITGYAGYSTEVNSSYAGGFMKKLFNKKKTETTEEEKPEPVVETKPEPVVETKPEPVVETKPEPVVETKPEPVVETKPEPVVETKPEPVVKAESAPAQQRPVQQRPVRQRTVQQRPVQQRRPETKPNNTSHSDVEELLRELDSKQS